MFNKMKSHSKLYVNRILFIEVNVAFIKIIIMTFEPPHEKTKIVVSEQVLHEPSCTCTEDGYMVEIMSSRSIRKAKAKALPASQ